MLFVNIVETGGSMGLFYLTIKTKNQFLSSFLKEWQSPYNVLIKNFLYSANLVLLITMNTSMPFKRLCYSFNKPNFSLNTRKMKDEFPNK